MVKVFELNKNGKIELTKDELQKLLNCAYWQGYNNKNVWTYTTPNYNTSTWYEFTDNPYTIKANDINSNSITIKGN